MAQVKIYGRRDALLAMREGLSRVVHACLVEALSLPEDKRFQRFFPLEPADFLFPPDRGERYTILEISMFAGRSTDAKRRLIRLLFERCRAELDLAPQDLEITIVETPRADWGIRGQPGDELGLGYTVEV